MSDAHRKRAARRLASVPNTVPPAPGRADTDGPSFEPGRARQGLEAWLTEIAVAIPPALVELARMLADEVDQSPERSPIHGRYLAVLQALREAAEPQGLGDDARQVLWKLQTACEYPAHRSAGLVHCAMCCGQAR